MEEKTDVALAKLEQKQKDLAEQRVRVEDKIKRNNKEAEEVIKREKEKAKEVQEKKEQVDKRHEEGEAELERLRRLQKRDRYIECSESQDPGI